MQLTKKDMELIDIAKCLLEENSDLYPEASSHVACALLSKSGIIYKGINIKTSHSICAEQVALGQALANGEREFDTIVAVKFDNERNAKVISPCGLCRYTFDKLGYDLNVIVEDIDHDRIVKMKASSLLPYPYKR